MRNACPPSVCPGLYVLTALGIEAFTYSGGVKIGCNAIVLAQKRIDSTDIVRLTLGPPVRSGTLRVVCVVFKLFTGRHTKCTMEEMNVFVDCAFCGARLSMLLQIERGFDVNPDWLTLMAGVAAAILTPPLPTLAPVPNSLFNG